MIASLLFAATVAVAPQVRDIKELLEHAATSGNPAQARIVGPLAMFFAKATSSNGHLIATVEEVERFSDPECARYSVVFSQEEARLASGARGPVELQMFVNYCVGGGAPTDGIDLDSLMRLFEITRRTPQ